MLAELAGPVGLAKIVSSRSVAHVALSVTEDDFPPSSSTVKPIWQTHHRKTESTTGPSAAQS
jgi:hypothetical protein